MNIVLVSTYEANGGAARAANRLFQGLRGLGADGHPLDCRLLVTRKETDDPGVEVLGPPSPGEQERGQALSAELLDATAPYPVLRMNHGFAPFHSDRSTAGEVLLRRLVGADVVNLHWVRGQIDYPAFFRDRPLGIPVVWTLHDMHPFTGGCHYAGSCTGFERACGACPVLGSENEEDLSRTVLTRKAACVARYPGPIHIVAPSRWLAEAARRSLVFAGLPVSIIPYGLDTSRFRPWERSAARQALGVPEGKPTVLFTAHGLNDPRKGLSLLDDALVRIGPHREVCLLLAGEGKVHLRSGVECIRLGVQDDAGMVRAYSAADAVAVTSTEDNLPNAVLEGMACGTAVIGTAVGGIPDVVRHGINGFLVASGDVASLAHVLDDALRDLPGLHAMGGEARRIVEREYSLEVQARRYLELYRSLVGAGRGAPL
ncbi:glycosyl transferase family 1 (plasmid) [Azospirillum argentinense]|uniref:Glycosyl transferase family 1 n=1 Tax=Azospirillum argentinense TaxID=2970906 RepID=A0A2K1FRL8_9PROT|nr:glycosyltransferase [Azospirillum argentinense]PNQ95181.1 glycosyl transferase family 1 [Azospirillum argentinense]